MEKTPQTWGAPPGSTASRPRRAGDRRARVPGVTAGPRAMLRSARGRPRVLEQPLLAIDDLAARFGGPATGSRVSLRVDAGETAGHVGPGPTILLDVVPGPARRPRGEPMTRLPASRVAAAGALQIVRVEAGLDAPAS